MNNYGIDEHTHRFAVWTAARAVQRSFTSTENIKQAIEKSELKNFLENRACKTERDFDAFHMECADIIITAFDIKNIKEVSYGRAAKIIAIYLKTSIIIRSGGLDDRCSFIHPPLDRILLSNLSELEGLKSLKNRKWTQLERDEYWEIVEIIRRSKYKLDWTLENYWEP